VVSFTPLLHYPGKAPPPSIHLIGDSVGPRAGLNDMEEWKFFTLPELELGPLGRPTRNQSLYRLITEKSMGDYYVGYKRV
jgi:hypothetical protein